MRQRPNFLTVLSLGGSLLTPSQPAVPFLRAFRACIVRHVRRGERFVVVTGGGQLNRTYNKVARSISRIAPDDLDWIGIAATRLHAELVRSAFGRLAFPRLIDNPAKPPKTKRPILVGGGYVPGSSTDYDAVLLAVALNARTVINLTDTKFVYDHDPRKNPKARPLPHLRWSEYRKLIPSRWTPRLSTPFDPKASRLAQAYGLTVRIVNGRRLSDFERALAGQPFRGTTIVP